MRVGVPFVARHMPNQIPFSVFPFRSLHSPDILFEESDLGQQLHILLLQVHYGFQSSMR